MCVPFLPREPPKRAVKRNRSGTQGIVRRRRQFIIKRRANVDQQVRSLGARRRPQQLTTSQRAGARRQRLFIATLQRSLEHNSINESMNHVGQVLISR